MMSHSASAACRLHPENGVNLFAAARCLLLEERHIARAEPSARGRQTPGQAMLVKAPAGEAGRAQREP
jgi:hypothetical protein